jgi:hypothetical protein
MECRAGCGACCIAISISTLDKPAGVACEHLTLAGLCGLWGKPERPDVCRKFVATEDFCGESREEAMELIAAIERQTKP